jgi:AsmA-like protein
VKRLRRVALVAASVALVVVAVAVVMALIATTHPDRVLAAVGKALGRDVRSGHMGVSVRGGLGVALSDVEITEDPAFGSEPFLRAERLGMRLRILPLLRRRVVVDGVLVDAPVVNLVRDASGRLNIDSLRKRGTGGGAAENARPAQPERPDFQLVSLRLRNGTFRYQERASDRTVELADVAVDARQPRFDAPVPVSLRARLTTRDLALDDIVSEGVLDLAAERPAYRGSLHAGPGTLGTLRLDRVTAAVRATPPIIDLDSSETETLGGKVTGSAHLDAASGFSAKLEAQGLDLAKLPAPADRPHPGGTLAFRGALAGPPPGARDFQNAVTGRGDFNVADGRIEGASFGRPILDALGPFIKQGVADRLRQRYPDLFAGDDLRFTRLSGSGVLEGGRIRSDDLVLEATSYEARGEGTLGLDGTIDVTVRLAASSALTDDVLGDSRARPALVDTRGRLTIPFRVHGSVRRPRVTPDPQFAASVARGLLGGSLGDVAGEALEQLFGGHHRHPR